MRTIYTSRWFPKGSIKITRKDAPAAVVYYYQQKGKFFALGFQGNRNKHDFHYGFSSMARCEAHVKGFFDDVAGSIKFKAEQKAKKAEAQATDQRLQVGDVLSYSWGYDQTNVEFFQVVSRSQRTVKVMAIKGGSKFDARGDMYERALPGQFTANAKPITKLEQFGYNGKPFLSMDHGCASVTTAEEKHYSNSYA